jgi:hippurate hydrolase
MRRRRPDLPVVAALLAGLAFSGATADVPPAAVGAFLERRIDGLTALYRHLHAHPELSLQEEETARRLAAELKRAGFQVTTGVGGHGVVAVFRNGEGPVVLWRSDLDALPVREETDLPYASRAVARDDAGREVAVMHACGHDVHMTVLVGLAQALRGFADAWSGTVVLIGQPAEERVRGARAMIEAGLFTRFPRPAAVLGLHVKPDLEAGTVGFRAGPAFANVDSVDIALFGRGGHGSAPHTTIDPVVIAARVVMALQTVVAREIDPVEPAVISVGSIHGGTKHNIIADRVDLQVTVRSYSDAVRQALLQGIERNVMAEAAGANAPRKPEVRFSEGTPATVNDPGLVTRTLPALRRALGEERVVEVPPIMGAEDFTYYGREGIPAFMFMLGTTPRERLEEGRRPGGRPIPSTHSALYHPEPDPSIRGGVAAAFAAVINLLQPR